MGVGGHDVLSEPIVELVGDSAALLLLGLNEPADQGALLTEQVQVMEDNRGMRAQRLHGGLIGLRKPPVVLFLAEPQASQHNLPARDRQVKVITLREAL